eukprot:12422678-Karenia_brevis.AAC.1
MGMMAIELGVAMLMVTLVLVALFGSLKIQLSFRCQLSTLMNVMMVGQFPVARRAQEVLAFVKIWDCAAEMWTQVAQMSTIN